MTTPTTDQKILDLLAEYDMVGSSFAKDLLAALQARDQQGPIKTWQQRLEETCPALGPMHIHASVEEVNDAMQAEIAELRSALQEQAREGEVVAIKDAVGCVLEGWTLPEPVRKILETAYYAAPQAAQTESIECDCGRIHKKTRYGWACSEPAQPDHIADTNKMVPADHVEQHLDMVAQPEQVEREGEAVAPLIKQIMEAICAGQKQRSGKSNKGTSQIPWAHTVGACAEVGNGANEHLQYRVGQTNAERSDHQCNSGCSGVSSGGAVCGQVAPQPEQGERAAQKAELLKNLTQWLDGLGGAIHTYSLRGIALHGFEKGWDAAMQSARPVAQPLTDEQIDAFWNQQLTVPQIVQRRVIARVIEAAHGIGGD